MKGGFYEMKSKQTSVILVTLVCTTILIFAWKKPPLLTSLLPPRGGLWQLSPDILVHGFYNAGAQPKDVMKKHVNAAAMSPGESYTDGGQELNESSNLVAPMASQITIAKVHEQENKTSTTLSKSQACNFAKGKWVIDKNRPLYSGFGCKRWLSKTWACRQTHRTDFDYEALRWQPTDCVTEEFTGHKFLERMQNKTLAFIGDSLGAEQCQSLLCMITGGLETPEVIDVGSEYGLDKPHGFNGWAYRFTTTNTTILFYWSTSLCDTEPRETDTAMHLDRAPAFLERHIHEFDVLVLNTWDHWTPERFKANRWVMHVGGVPYTNGNSSSDITDIASAMNFTIHGIVHWVDTQMEKYPGLRAFYRSLSPRHFSNGEWNNGGTCENTTPLVRGSEVFEDESGDSVASSAVKGTKVKLLDITALSELRDEGHISKYSKKARPGVQDCLHWCLPGVPDTWNEILFAQM